MKEKIRHILDRVRRWYAKRITSRYPEKKRLRKPSFATRYRIARDRRLNTPFPAVRDFIGAQGGGGEADRLHFGFAKMSFCGCEVIAVYNALLHLGWWKDIRRVAQDLMAHGAVFGGLLGVRPDAIASYFARNHFPVRFEAFTENGVEMIADGLAPEEGSEPEAVPKPESEPAGQPEREMPEAPQSETAEAPETEDREIQESSEKTAEKKTHHIPEGCVELLTFWNGPDSWTIHTVMIEPLENGMLRIYNRHTNTLYTIYSSYDQVLSAADIVPIARITVGQRIFEEEEELKEAASAEETDEAAAEATAEEAAESDTAEEEAAEPAAEEAAEEMAEAEAPEEAIAEETTEGEPSEEEAEAEAAEDDTSAEDAVEEEAAESDTPEEEAAEETAAEETGEEAAAEETVGGAETAEEEIPAAAITEETSEEAAAEAAVPAEDSTAEAPAGGEAEAPETDREAQ